MFNDAVRTISFLALITVGCAYAYDIGLNFGFSSDAEARESTTCGALYTVTSGDTLAEISIRAYGTSRKYKTIFETNRKVLKNAATLEVGDRLLLPCLQGSNPQIGDTLTAAAPAADPKVSARAQVKPQAQTRPKSVASRSAEDESPSAPFAAPEIGTISFLTGSDFAPFVDAASPQGGMITELIRLSMSGAGPDQTFKIAQVDDWSRHLDLLGRRDFDLGFPWYRPDCARAETLSASMQRRCAEFDFSEPLFEVDIGYYVRVTSALTHATGHGELAGSRICRPASHFTFDLEQLGLVEPNATLITPRHVSDCLALLEQRQVDVVNSQRTLFCNSIINRFNKF
jgi:polar amino acid transport system substrate-binding protein